MNPTSTATHHTHRNTHHKGLRRRPGTPMPTKKPYDIIPPLGDNIRIIPLGGVEEIGRNMTVIEFGNDIIVCDAGIKFTDDDTPGIDYITKHQISRGTKR
jgi:ribonuclease J